MSAFDLNFNKDDVALRNIIVGLLSTLSNNINWFNQIGQKSNEKSQVIVPFYFSISGSERYLQDNFLNNIDSDPEQQFAETFYADIPRGIVNFESFSVDTQSITNKYVRMNHLIKELDGSLNTYNSEAFMVPITITVNVEIFLDSILDQLKCSESIIKTFFKAKIYQVDISNTRIPCVITFPDDYNQDRAVEFTFDDKKQFKVKFDLEIKSFIPIFKAGTTLFAGTRMESFKANTYIPESIINHSIQTNIGDTTQSTENLDSRGLGSGDTIDYGTNFDKDKKWPLSNGLALPPK